MSADALKDIFAQNPHLRTRGFLPAEDPLRRFSLESGLVQLDLIGVALPKMLKDQNFRSLAQRFVIPMITGATSQTEIEHYYTVVSFIASAYVHQIDQTPATVLPRNIAAPLANVCWHLNRPPILSYDAYALYNWKRIDPQKGIVLGNLEVLQNFVDLSDAFDVNQESWFIMIHVAIEQIGAEILEALYQYITGQISVDAMLQVWSEMVTDMTHVLKRIPEHMDPNLYHRTFRTYINGFHHGVVYEGVRPEPVRYRGETGAQSSIMPLLEAVLKTVHQVTALTEQLDDFRNYMPTMHRELLRAADSMPSIRESAHRSSWNSVLTAMAGFRSVHLFWAQQYIAKHVSSPKGTGGTDFIAWLSQLIDETLAARK